MTPRILRFTFTNEKIPQLLTVGRIKLNVSPFENERLAQSQTGFKKQNGYILHEKSMADEGGHQLAMIEYPNLPREYALDAVHRFYDEYYFRPKQIWRIVRRAMFDSNDRKRLYKEAREFMDLRAKRKKVAQGLRADTVKEQAAAAGAD